ncbi:ribonuclease H-like domain-containing protein [Tanacetum coccineum]|uniref:Ribonuclease H-like domain-containing protein n=1 Tax=Tanacetum coccineum TaxID=301880 RepID=A0ABQ4Z7R1_9ASTR
MAFVSSSCSSTETDTANVQVSTVSTPISTASTYDDTAKLSDATVYAFIANQPNRSHLVHEYLEQIHEDDLKEMDLKGQLALLSMRARKFYQRTGMKITINGSDTAGYDKSKVECFNCHKMGHFTRECRGPRNQDSRPRNQDRSKRTMNVEDTSSKAMVAFDGAVFYWSFMTEEEYDNLRIEFNKSEFDLATYKRGLASIEEQLVFYKKNKVSDCDDDESEEMALKSGNVQPKPKQANGPKKGNPQVALKDIGIFDSGCSWHMTGNKSYLTDYQDYDGGFVAFAGSFKGGLTCLFAKATNDESKLWHWRLGHINFKTMNKLVKGNLVRGLPSKIFKNDHTCVACQKGKQHKASCIENQLNYKVKIIRCDNGTEFKNYEMNQFYGIKGIKREFSNARTPQQNGVAERKNRTLIEATRTMLADSLLPIPFWAEAVNNACYVQNRVLVTKPHNKTPYELLIGRTPIISFMRPFSCPVTILNTLDHLGKFDGNADEGFLVGYSINSKAFRVFNSRTRKVEENLHVNFLEKKPNVARTGPKWLFDIESLTSSMNYQLVSVGNRTNVYAGSETNSNTCQAEKEKGPELEYILLPLLHISSNVPSSSEEAVCSPKDDAGKKANEQLTCDKRGQSDDL